MSKGIVITNVDERGVAEVILNRPERNNAYNGEMISELIKSFTALYENQDVRVVLLRGNGNHFQGGADLEWLKEIGKLDQEENIEVSKRTASAIRGLMEFPKPTIAMIDGFALGGGTELALSCDIRIASNRSKFGTPEINLGLIPGGGGTQRLCRLIGYGKALEMVLTGDMIDSEQALSYGLVNSVTTPEQLKQTTMQLAENIARKSPYTTKVAKRAVRASLDLPFSEGVRMERSEFVALFDTEDKEIGVNAFLNRESPKWLGK
jgi:enoyl-CoA hydratase/carnithine racemase